MRAGLADDPTVQLVLPLLCAQTAVVQTERDQNGRTRKVCRGTGRCCPPSHGSGLSYRPRAHASGPGSWRSARRDKPFVEAARPDAHHAYRMEPCSAAVRRLVAVESWLAVDRLPALLRESPDGGERLLVDGNTPRVPRKMHSWQVVLNPPDASPFFLE